MNIEEKQIEKFRKDGYLLLDKRFPEERISELRKEIDAVSRLDGPEFFADKSGGIRTIFSPENYSEKFRSLINDELLVRPLRQLFNEPFYLFQSKFNDKKSMQSGSWPWHQDFTFWEEDGMLADKAITAAIYLTDITDFSGPIICVPGSHKHGRIETILNNPDGVHDEDLKYLIAAETLRKITDRYGEIVSTKGKAGSVLYFHSNILHGSFQNMYYSDRKIMMFTYNPTNNIAKELVNPRASFMVKRDFTII